MLQNNYEINFVETYIIDEVKEMIYDDKSLKEFNDIINELGLEGQKTLKKDNKSPIPFAPLKKIEENVFKELCPNTTRFDEFDDTPIPLEILKLIKLGIKEDYFQNVEIWHDYKKPDPVAIGSSGYWYAYKNSKWKEIRDENNETMKWNSRKELEKLKEDGADIGSIFFFVKKQYLIGRWSDVKADFAELTKRAKESFIARKTTTLKKNIKEAQRELDDINETVHEQFGV